MMTEKELKGTAQRALNDLIEGRFYDDYDFANGPGLRALAIAVERLQEKTIFNESVESCLIEGYFSDRAKRKISLEGSSEDTLSKHKFEGDESDLRMRFNEVLAGGTNMNGDSGWIIHTDGHAKDLEAAIEVISWLREKLATQNEEI